MSRDCTICKHYGEPTLDSKTLERAQLFDESGTALNIHLCRKHAVELFKNGQRKFLVSHYKILVDIISSDEMKFISILEKTIRSNMDDIY
jgi:hypothetical protein